MKSYILAPIASREAAISVLNSALPAEGKTWILKDSSGDAVAYFDLVECDFETGLRTISADVSGRHYNEDAKVVSVMEKLKVELGGEITLAA